MPSSDKGSGGNTTPPFKTYMETFVELFPYYLSIGMTDEQYWNKDSTLAIAYRKAEEMRNERKNQEMWLQGAYIYEALCKVSPILHAFAKKGTKPSPYVSEPYSITKKQLGEEQAQNEKKTFEKNKSIMEGFMIMNNRKFERE